MGPEKPIIAVCGKGGVGKTAFSALLARILIEAGRGPLLLIDADPAGGLAAAIGARVEKTLGSVRDELIGAARRAEDAEKERLAGALDYLVLEALVEYHGYSLLAMGRSREKGCYCPVNSLLREAIDLLSAPFAAVLIDAEAGLEQINRQVTRRVTRVVAVTDGSRRGAETIRSIAALTGGTPVTAVANRVSLEEAKSLPDDVPLVGAIPEDGTLRDYDRRGRSLWELPSDNAALGAAVRIAGRLGLLADGDRGEAG